VGVGDNQLDSAQAAFLQAAQELSPERLGLAVTGRAAQRFLLPSALTPVAMTTAWATIRCFRRTLQYVASKNPKGNEL
jgi:hypothetical protein